jgi:3-oxoacyl-[acyl-carrier protein] reductase
MSLEQLFDLTGQVALVTGASSGLGWRFAEVLAARGAKVVLAARRIERLEELKVNIERAGGQAHCVALDVADKDAIAAAFDEAEKVFSTVTLLVNNAGMAIQKMALDTTDKDWRRLMDVNLDSVWNCSREAAKRMIAAGRPGSIINVASVLGLRVAGSLSVYAITKAAVAQMTKALAVEFARFNIRVNAVAPGYIRTEINQEFLDSPASEAMIKNVPQRRFGQPSDLDGTVLLLASAKAGGFMTGAVVVVDGGQTLPIV